MFSVYVSDKLATDFLRNKDRLPWMVFRIIPEEDQLLWSIEERQGETDRYVATLWTRAGT